MPNPKPMTVHLCQGAVAHLDDMLPIGVSRQLYLEALINYAASVWQRPGSWEAAAPFRIGSYLSWGDDECGKPRLGGGNVYADVWFQRSDTYEAMRERLGTDRRP